MPFRLFGAPALILLSGALAWAADWLSYAPDPQHAGWQKHEKILNPSNVRGLELVWKRRLENAASGLNSLTAPVILGRLITHRGMKELIFIGGSSDRIFAVDADLGTLFWTRRLETGSGPPCGDGMTAAPVLAPRPPGTEDLDDDEVPQTVRPVYALASDGRLHALSPLTGEDIFPPLRFLARRARASALSLAGGVVYTVSTGGCGAKTGAFGIDVKTPGSAPFAVSGNENAPDKAGASRMDANGTRWSYKPSPGGIEAFKSGDAGSARVWAHAMPAPESIAVAGGVVFVLTRGSPAKHSVLYALDATTGAELYSSGDRITSYVDSSALAIANGHICFGTHDNTLYCFGFPLDR